MKTAIIGANGQLGVDLCRVLRKQGITLTALTHKDVEVASSEQVDRVLEAIGPDTVISTAAFHKVEKCEKEPAPSFAVNATGPRNLALACPRLGAAFVHFSTDYVFDGSQKQPYCETDLPQPLNVYGVSKLAGEAWFLLPGRATLSSAPAGCTESPAVAGKAGISWRRC